MAEVRTILEAERCENTIKNVIDNSLDTEKNQILELIDIMVRKMVPPMKRFLTEGAEVLHEDSNSIERLLIYLERSLSTLHDNLNEQNFERILDAIWRELAIIMYDLIQSNLAVSYSESVSTFFKKVPLITLHRNEDRHRFSKTYGKR